MNGFNPNKPNPQGPGYKAAEFHIRSVPELLAWQPPTIEYIIDQGLLWPQSRMVIYGLWKSWKSMVAQEISFAIATGKPWLNFRTTPKTVLNLQLEIPEFLLKERVSKYAHSHLDFPQGLRYWTHHYLKLDRDYGVKFLEDALAQYHPEVLVVDPIYKVVTGNISDSYDVGKFLDMMDLLMEKWNFALILVHHERKPQSNPDGVQLPSTAADMMGSSYILNWLDTGVMLERLGGPNSTTIQITFDPVRHARDELPTLKVNFDRTSLGASIIGQTAQGLWVP